MQSSDAIGFVGLPLMIFLFFFSPILLIALIAIVATFLLITGYDE